MAEMRDVSYAPGDILADGRTVYRVVGQRQMSDEYPWQLRLELVGAENPRIMGVRTQPRIMGDLRMHAQTDGYAIRLK